MRSAVVTAYLALGANLGDPVAQIADAIRRLGQVPGLRPRRRARLYGSTPVGPQDQPNFVNTALEIETALAPLDLLDAAQRVEDAMGRVRTQRWGPRVIDIDVALYADVTWSDDRLVVPHPELCRRSFVLRPLADLCPELGVPPPPGAAALGSARTVAAWSARVREPPIDVLDDAVQTL